MMGETTKLKYWGDGCAILEVAVCATCMFDVEVVQYRW